MKEVPLDQFTKNAEAVVAEAHGERIILTRDGKPFASVRSLDNKDEEDLEYERSPEFWRMIQERRRRPTRPLRDAMADLFPEGQGSEG